MGNLFTDKYAEGYVNHRFYAGCDNVDAIEAEGARVACELFGADHAFLQPHSGADANLVAFMAILSAKVEAPVLAEIGEDGRVEALPRRSGRRCARRCTTSASWRSITTPAGT